MAGEKSVRLSLLGDNTDAKLKIDAIDIRAKELADMHPELKIGLDSAAAQEKLAVLRTELKETAAQATVAGDDMEAAGAKSGRGAELSEKAWGVAKLAILGVAGAMGFGIYKAASFNQEMEHLHTQAGVSVGTMNTLSKGVLQLAGQVGQNPDSLAEAAYHVASNMASMGATSQQMLSAVKVAAEGASVGGADLVDVTNALGAAIASGIPGVQNYQSAMGALNATVGAGDMKMQDLAEAMGTGFLSNVKIYGSTLNDVGAILATFGDNNIRGSHAGTQLRMSVQSLAVQASSAKPYLKELGLSIGELGKYQSLHGTVATVNLLVDRLKAAGVKSTDYGNIITQLFGKKAGAGIAVLVDQVDRLNSKQAVLTKGANEFGKAWDAQQGTTQQQMKDLQAGSEALAISLGEKLLPAANDVMRGMNSFLQLLQRNSAVAGTFAGIIGSVLAGLALKKAEEGVKGAIEGFEGLWGAGQKVAGGIGSLASKLGIFKTASAEAAVAAEGETAAQEGLNVAMDANPIGLIIIGITALVIAFKLLWDHSAAFRDFWKDTWKIIVEVVEGVFNWVKGHWPLILDILTGPIGIAANFIGGHWRSIENGARSMFNNVVGFFRSMPGMIVNALGNLGGLLYNAGWNVLVGFWNGLVGMWNKVQNFVSGIAGWISAHKGPISYDAVLLRPHGRAIMSGLVGGLQDGMPGLTQQLSRTTSAIANTRIPSSAVAGSAGNAQLQVEWVGGSGADQEFISWLKKNIRIRGGDPGVLGR